VHPWQSLAVLTVVTIVLAALGVVLTGGDPVSVDLAGVADGLAIAVSVQWEAEARWRQLNDPYPMRVHWGAADPDVVADWPALVRLATTGPGWPVPAPGKWAAGPAELAGADNDLVDVLGRVPTGRLVVLGEPGAGKTILLVRLVLDLLARRGPGEAVPILLPLASWNPVEQDLFGWMERWLTTDNAALADPAPGLPGISRARALLDAGLILPVLDGLDEIPDAIRGPAIARINDAMRPGKRLILAARTHAYRTAVHPPGGVEIRLTGAAGIQLCPLDAGVVADYLKDSAGGPAGAARWDPIVATFETDDPPPVARALTTPLMAALARANYNPRPDENVAAIPDHPVELLDPARFPDPETIRLYLFDRFVPSAYREHPDSSRRIRCSAAEAERWLVFLARDLQHRQHGTTDLAWWELHGAAPRTLAALTTGTVAGLVAAFGFSFPLDKGTDIGLGIGLVTAILVGLLVRGWVRIGGGGLTRGLAGGLLGGQLGALTSLAIFGAGVEGHNIATFLAGGLGFGIAVAPLGKVVASLIGAFAGETFGAFLSHATIVDEIGGIRGPVTLLTNGIGFGFAVGVAVALANRRTPARGMRWSPLGLVCGLVTGLVIGGVTWIQVGPMGGLLVGLVGMVTGGYAGGLAFEVAATDLTKATTPAAVLERDRSAFRSGGLGPGIAIGVSTGLAVAISPGPDGQPNGLHFGLGVGLADIIGVGLAAGFLQASWGSFTLARWWLAASGRLPWRLMTFLADAHTNRGVLRQVGAVYQFRHAELQRRLAADVDRSAVIDAGADPADRAAGADPAAGADETGLADGAGADQADDGQGVGAPPSARPGSACRSRVL